MSSPPASVDSTPEDFDAYRERFKEALCGDLVLAVDRYHHYRREYDKVVERLDRLCRVDVGTMFDALSDIHKLGKLAWERAAVLERYQVENIRR